MPGKRQPTDVVLANGRKHPSRAEEADGWSRIQDRYFKQTRACANDMGLTITSRCRLVVPGAGEPDEPENPFLQLIQGGASRRA